MPRGGKRPGAGRKPGFGSKKGPGVLPVLDRDSGRQFAARVLNRIKQGPPEEIKSSEDYVLALLFDRDVQTKSHTFHRLLDRRYGPPAKILEVSGRDGEPIPLDLSGDSIERLNSTIRQLRERIAKRAASSS
jgi:hypothetical protein